MKKRALFTIFWVMLASILAFPQTVTVTGTISAIGVGGDAGSNNDFVVFRLRGYQGNLPRVNGVELINVLNYTATPNSAGQFSVTLFGNDQVTPTNTYYVVEQWSNGKISSSANYQFCTNSSCPQGIASECKPLACNLNSQPPLQASPPNILNVAPLLGTNNIFSGTNTFSGAVTFNSAVALGGVTTACNINGQLVVASGCFPGADIGAQVNAAYASCPANGCQIKIPSGIYPFTTTMLFGLSSGANSVKPVVLQCDGSSNGLSPTVTGSVELLYTGTGAAVVFSDGGVTGSGMRGCTLIGPGAVAAPNSKGLVCGPTSSLDGFTANGVCQGHYFETDDISNFAVGVQQGGISSFLNTFFQLSIHDNGKQLYLTNQGGQNPGNEENKFIGGQFSAQTLPSPTCIDTSGSTFPYDVAFIGVSLDQCPVNIVGPGMRFRFSDSHLELNTGFAAATPFVVLGSSCSGCDLHLSATDIIEDATPPGCIGTCRPAFIVNNNTLNAAAVILYGGRYLSSGTEPNFPIILDSTGTNISSVQNTYKSGPVASNVGGPTGAAFSSMEYSQLTLQGTVPSLTINGEFSSLLNLVPATIGTIPLCAPSFLGTITTITNSNTQAYGAIIAPGGLFAVIVCDGTNWRVMGF